MKFLYPFSLLFLLILSNGCRSQTRRFYDKVLISSDPFTVEYANGLSMDIYLPEKDTMSARPVILYVHGGGFSGGSRADDGISTFCEDLSQRGYATISMSYRLTMKGKGFGCDISAKEKIDVFRMAGEDISRATAFIRENASKWKVNPDRIILAGSSAGAEAVLHAAYWKDTYRFDGKQVLPEDFRYAGLISMAGALKDINLITAENAIPTQLFHGTCDNLVPYLKAPHHYCGEGDPGYLILYGGGSIASHLDELDRSYYLVTICGGGHEWAGAPMGNNMNEIVDFLYYDVIQGLDRKTNRTFVDSHGCDQMPGVPACR